MKGRKLLRKLPVGILRFFAWWGGMFAILGGTTGGICPFCGQPGCMGGPASVGFLAGLVAIFMSLPKLLGRRFKARLIAKIPTLHYGQQSITQLE